MGVEVRSYWPRVLGGVIVVAVVAVFGVKKALGPRVRTITAVRRELVQTVVSSGHVRSPAELNLGVQLGGVVETVAVREGDRVRAGEVLITLDERELRARVDEARAAVRVAEARAGQVRTVSGRVAEASVRQAEAGLREAEARWRRESALAETGATSRAELDAAERGREVARGQVEAARVGVRSAGAGGAEARAAGALVRQAEAGLRVAEARVAEARVVAPADGVVLRRSVEPGDIVTAGRVLMVMAREGETELEMNPDERVLSELAVGQRAVASAEAFEAMSFDAVVSYIAPAVELSRGTVEVRLRVASAPRYLRPSMTVSVEVEVARRAGVLVLGVDGVRGAATRSPWVMVVRNGRTERRAVSLGLRGDRGVELRSGLREGERVVPVTERVTEGQRVRVMQ